MNQTTRPATSRWAVLALIAASVALASCGRKAGLDLPPQAGSQADLAASAPAQPASTPVTQGPVAGPFYGNTQPDVQAEPGQKRPFVLDRLLD